MGENLYYYTSDKGLRSTICRDPIKKWSTEINRTFSKEAVQNG
jgi:hypothetical protein